MRFAPAVGIATAALPCSAPALRTEERQRGEMLQWNFRTGLKVLKGREQGQW
jgi:hypothetical protein